MYTMMQVCRTLDMTYQTLKFYCNEGLVPNVKRDSNNRRIFDERDVKWIKDLTCLKKCGMSIQEMKRIFGTLYARRIHHSFTKRNVKKETGILKGDDPRIGRQRRLYRLETKLFMMRFFPVSVRT